MRECRRRKKKSSGERWEVRRWRPRRRQEKPRDKKRAWGCAEIHGNRGIQPPPRLPFRIVEFGCRCSCRHFNSGECIICILAVRPLRAGTVSPGSNGHRRVSQQSDRCGQRAVAPLFFHLSLSLPPPSLFSISLSLFLSPRVVARQIRIKEGREAARERHRKRTVKDKNPMFSSLRGFHRRRRVYSHEKERTGYLSSDAKLECDSFVSRKIISTVGLKRWPVFQLMPACCKNASYTQRYIT